MDARQFTTIEQVLLAADSLSSGYAVFSFNKQPLTVHQPVMLAELDLLEPDEDEPAQARELGYRYILGVSELQDVVTNARLQVSAPTLQQLLDALNFYFARDAFIEFSDR
jgi:hypothetical protein